MPTVSDSDHTRSVLASHGRHGLAPVPSCSALVGPRKVIVREIAARKLNLLRESLACSTPEGAHVQEGFNPSERSCHHPPRSRGTQGASSTEGQSSVAAQALTLHLACPELQLAPICRGLRPGSRRPVALVLVANEPRQTS